MYLAFPENSPELVTGCSPGKTDANRRGEDPLGMLFHLVISVQVTISAPCPFKINHCKNTSITAHLETECFTSISRCS